MTWIAPNNYTFWPSAPYPYYQQHSGWRCPGCGRCYSPSTSQCSSCVPWGNQWHYPTVQPNVWGSMTTTTNPVAEEEAGSK